MLARKAILIFSNNYFLNTQKNLIFCSKIDDWNKDDSKMIFCKNFENKIKMSPSPPHESYKVPLKSSSPTCKKGRDYCSCRNCYSKVNNNNIIDVKYERREEDNPMMARRSAHHDKEVDFRKNTSPFDDFERGLMRQHSERYRKSAERQPPPMTQQYDDRFERSARRSKPDEHKKKIATKNFENEKVNLRNNSNKFSHRNPYREPDNHFYHESVENMMKSPLLNNFTNRKQYRGANDEVNDEQYHLRKQQQQNQQKQQQRQGDYELENGRKATTHSAPESSLRKTSAKERFMNAKEKFQAMAETRNRYEDIHPHSIKEHRHMAEKCPSDVCSDCSLDDNSSPCEDSDCSKRNNLNFYRQSQLTKSLGNLTRGGYRHSVALPDINYKYCNRVGLAAIDY